MDKILFVCSVCAVCSVCLLCLFAVFVASVDGALWIKFFPFAAFALFVLFVHVCLWENVASVDRALDLAYYSRVDRYLIPYNIFLFLIRVIYMST